MDFIASGYAKGLITAYVHLKPDYFVLYYWELCTRAPFEATMPFTIEREMGDYEEADCLRKLNGTRPVAPAPGREAPRYH